MWIKICGIRDLPTAKAIAAQGVDALGLNFFRRSPRSIDVVTAREIAAAVSPEVKTVGLFVNHSVSEIAEIQSGCQLAYLQLHGDETPQMLRELQSVIGPTPLLRAFRIGAEGCAEVRDYLAECQNLGVSLAGCLIDARVDGAYGGTGHTAPWDLIAEQYDAAAWPPLIVAGGLVPENVATAIARTHPWGVDVASGVESAPGVKDINQVRQFVEAVRRTESLVLRRDA